MNEECEVYKAQVEVLSKENEHLKMAIGHCQNAARTEHQEHEKTKDENLRARELIQRYERIIDILLEQAES